MGPIAGHIFLACVLYPCTGDPIIMQDKIGGTRSDQNKPPYQNGFEKMTDVRNRVKHVEQILVNASTPDFILQYMQYCNMTGSHES